MCSSDLIAVFTWVPASWDEIESLGGIAAMDAADTINPRMFVIGAVIIGILLDRITNVPIAWFFAATVIFIAGVVVLAWIKRLDSHYTVTSRRVIVRRGIANRNERSASIDRIQNVNTRQGFYGRILNFGDIEFDTAGSDKIGRAHV